MSALRRGTLLALYHLFVFHSHAPQFLWYLATFKGVIKNLSQYTSTSWENVLELQGSAKTWDVDVLDCICCLSLPFFLSYLSVGSALPCRLYPAHMPVPIQMQWSLASPITRILLSGRHSPLFAKMPTFIVAMALNLTRMHRNLYLKMQVETKIMAM